MGWLIRFSFCGLTFRILILWVGWLDSRFFVGCLVESWFFMLVGYHFVGSLVGSSFCGLFSWIFVL